MGIRLLCSLCCCHFIVRIQDRSGCILFCVFFVTLFLHFFGCIVVSSLVVLFACNFVKQAVVCRKMLVSQYSCQWSDRANYST